MPRGRRRPHRSSSAGFGVRRRKERRVGGSQVKKDGLSQTVSVAFDTTVSAAGNNTGIVVPDEVIERLGAGRRPSVVVDVNGYEYRSTVAVMGGKHMIGISAAIRKETGLKGGDPITVRLSVATSPREVHVPADFA